MGRQTHAYADTYLKSVSFDDDEILCFQPQKDTTLPYVKEFNSQLVLICRYLQEKY